MFLFFVEAEVRLAMTYVLFKTLEELKRENPIMTIREIPVEERIKRKYRRNISLVKNYINLLKFLYEENKDIDV